MNTVLSPEIKVFNGLTANSVPLKMRAKCPTAKELFQKIYKFETFDPVVRTLVREKTFVDENQARHMIEGFMQWYCTGAVTKTKSFVMFVGPLDSVFHAMILNSKWYFDFCCTFTGVYTHHEPVEESGISVDQAKLAISETLNLIKSTWGNDSHEEIKKIYNQHEAGELTASSVSCLGNGGPWDVVPAKVLYNY
jgi:hypothetical protein